LRKVLKIVADEWISINVQHHVDGWISTIK
jgi:hypothetical protein